MVVLTPAEVARIDHEARVKILEYVLGSPLYMLVYDFI